MNAIRQAKQKVGKLRPIDKVVFAQNVPKYNPEWEHSTNRQATSYLATLVCRYMHELQQKDKKWYSAQKLWKRFTIQQVAPLENSSPASNIWADTHLSKCMTRLKQRGRSYHLKRKRSCHKDLQDWRRQVVA